MNGANPRSANSAHGQSSSLERLQADARSPRSRSGADYPRDERDDTVEMSLLGNGGRVHDSSLLAEEEEHEKDRAAKPMSKKDKKAMTLLIILCTSRANLREGATRYALLIGRVISRSYSGRPGTINFCWNVYFVITHLLTARFGFGLCAILA